MKILITGISGGGGRHLAEYLLPYGHEIIGVFRSNKPNLPDCVRVCKLDMLSEAIQLYELIQWENPDIIFHFASLADVRESFKDPHFSLANNVGAATQLFEAVLGAKLQSYQKHNPVIVNVSSSEVYGTAAPEDIPITESCPLNPASPYAVSKTAQDLLGRVYWKSYGLRIVTTRMFTYLSPYRANLFIGSFAKQIAEIEVGTRSSLRHGNLDSVRTVMDARDAAEAYWLAAMECEPGEVYNIGGETTLTVGEILNKMMEKARCEIKLEHDPDLIRPVDVTSQIPCSTKFRDQTGWFPKRQLDETLDYILNFWRQNVGS